MRAISGFERPAFQWLFVALGVLLILTTAGASWVARRATIEREAARAEEEAGRLERQNLEAQLARERSGREALALELDRLRAAAGPAEGGHVLPTLTLMPATTRGASPPAPTVAPQHATQLVELRLILPRDAQPYTRFDVVWREWSSGVVVWSRGALAPTSIDGRSGVTALVTGDVLRTGAYEIQLSGTSAEGRKAEVAAYDVAVR